MCLDQGGEPDELVVDFTDNEVMSKIHDALDTSGQLNPWRVSQPRKAGTYLASAPFRLRTRQTNKPSFERR